MIIGNGIGIGMFNIITSYTSEYQLILDVGQTAGHTLPSDRVKLLDNQMIRSDKNSGVWQLRDVLYVFNTDGDSNFATLNWKAPESFQATKVNNPLFTALQGFTPNGTNSYLNLNWVPSTHGVNYTLNNAGYGLYVRTKSTAVLDRCEIGARSGSSSLAAFYQAVATGATTASYGTNISAVNSIYAAASTTGFVHIKRTASNAQAIFKDGVSKATSTTASSGLPIYSFYVGALNQANVAAAFSSAQISMVWTGASLNGKESDSYTSWNTRLTSL